jgi:hypothetical protein
VEDKLKQLLRDQQILVASQNEKNVALEKTLEEMKGTLDAADQRHKEEMVKLLIQQVIQQATQEAERIDASAPKLSWLDVGKRTVFGAAVVAGGVTFGAPALAIGAVNLGASLLWNWSVERAINEHKKKVKDFKEKWGMKD